MPPLPPFFGSYFCKNGHIDLCFFLNSFMVVADIMSDAQFSTWSSWSTTSFQSRCIFRALFEVFCVILRYWLENFLAIELPG